MKKTVLTFGLISGAIVALMMLVSCMIGYEKIGFENGELIGYTTMILAFSMVFFGIRSYRQNVLSGAISFGKAFKVGILIVLISSLCYVVSWMFINKFMYPEFMDEYSKYYIEKLREGNAGQEKIQAAVKDMAKYKEWLKNPLISFGFTFMEIFPVGLVVTLISAAILRKRTPAVN